jgi:enoyl-CoA hydratase/carnithine racemase
MYAQSAHSSTDRNLPIKSIRFERNDNIGSVVLASSPYNGLDVRFASCLEEVVHEASERDVSVLVVRVEGPNFSRGGEVREWQGKDAK